MHHKTISLRKHSINRCVTFTSHQHHHSSIRSFILYCFVVYCMLT